MADHDEAEIEETPLIPPHESVVKGALVASIAERDRLCAEAKADPDKFWAAVAENLHWHRRWETVSRWNFDVRKPEGIHIGWFLNGQTNMCYNALDRHVDAGAGARIAYHFEGNEPGEALHLTYADLLAETCRIANFLADGCGVGEGDRVTLYLPMIPTVVAVMLACSRIGAVLNVVFAGFSAQALAARIIDSGSRVVVTADVSLRGPKSISLKRVVDDACKIVADDPAAAGGGVRRVVVVRHAWATATATHTESIAGPGVGPDCPMQAGRDVWLHNEIGSYADTRPVVWRDAEAPLFMLYTSGSTGKPKALLHTTGGYMVYAWHTTRAVFDLQPGRGDVYFATADVGWITGHTYVVFGPLLVGVTSVLFEGVPTHPSASRLWEIVDKFQVRALYTAPTAIRALMALGDEAVTRTSRATLRVLGSVGEPINAAAWRWYHTVVGRGVASVVDTWWQTETGGILVTGLPGADGMRPSWAGLPLPGVEPAVLLAARAAAGGAEPGLDETPHPVAPAGRAKGLLCLQASWPGQARTIYNDHERFQQVYFRTCPGFYFTGDGCVRDADGRLRLTGRVDDVLNVSGHRLGTAEVECALNASGIVVESAVVGAPHDVKGECIYAYVVPAPGVEFGAAEKAKLVASVRTAIGPIATPDFIHATPGLPKTRSGKIMRRILRKIAAGSDAHDLGDVSTLADPLIVEQLLASRPPRH